MPLSRRFLSAGRALFLAAALWLMVAGARAADPQHWQLHFQYDEKGVRLIEAAEIAPMAKTPVTPGLAGAPARLAYGVEWLDAAGGALAKGEAELPLGIRSALAEGAPCQTTIPPEGAFVVRLAGPASGSRPAALKLSLKAARGRAAGRMRDWPTRAFDAQEMSLAVESVRGAEAVVPLVQGPKSATKIRNTGADSNRLVMVVMGDGYTAANLSSGKFTTNAAALLTSFMAKPPWDVYFAGTNVYRLDVESNQAGADREFSSTSPIVDTYFNSTFWSFGIDRLLTIDATGSSRAISAADSLIGVGVWDSLFVLVNSMTYGGSGGMVGVASIHEDSDEVIVHEFGHSFVNLADEYDDPYPGFPPGDSEANVDYNFSGSGLKWLPWVEGGTPLPTPETSGYASVVGAFEGARYLTSGIYRPWLNCLMRALNAQFCPVCKEAHVHAYASVVQMIDGATPSVNSTFTVPGGGGGVTVAPWPVGSLTYQWYINNNLLAGQSGPTVNLMPSDIPGGSADLKLRVSHTTSLVRISTDAQEFHWTAQASPESPTPSLTPTVTPTLSISPTPTPFNSASFSGESIPDTVYAGESLNVGIVVQNTGNTTWAQGGNYSLAVVSDPCGAFASHQGRIAITAGESAGPGAIHTFNAALAAPLAPGPCAAQFQMVQEFVEFFGPVVQASFNVAARPNASADWSLYE